jgi:hypothetical protein
MVGGDLNDFDESVNHYLKEHGYKLLHVGQETSSDGEGNLWQKTAAVIGKEKQGQSTSGVCPPGHDAPPVE